VEDEEDDSSAFQTPSRSRRSSSASKLATAVTAVTTLSGMKLRSSSRRKKKPERFSPSQAEFEADAAHRYKGVRIDSMKVKELRQHLRAVHYPNIDSMGKQELEETLVDFIKTFPESMRSYHLGDRVMFEMSTEELVAEARERGLSVGFHKQPKRSKLLKALYSDDVKREEEKEGEEEEVVVEEEEEEDQQDQEQEEEDQEEEEEYEEEELSDEPLSPLPFLPSSSSPSPSFPSSSLSVPVPPTPTHSLREVK
jgi:cobalamin biosynthesis protein CobT